jgi:NAD(P)H-hydrate epimerase
MSEPILDAERMRAYDAHAIEECAVPSVVLMENAGRGATDVVYEHESLGPVIVVCGTGNNGGDGFVVARHLLARGVHAEVVLLGAPEKTKGDAKLNLEALLGLGGRVEVVADDALSGLEMSLETAALVVDAIFGTGLSRAVEGRYARVIEAMNATEAPRVALDIPSGIDATTGAVLGVAIEADATVTFGRYKSGLFQAGGVTHSGEVTLAGLGIPDAAILDEVGHEAALIDALEVADDLGTRPPDAHKYRAGSVLAVAGSVGKLGAALLVARGILRSGAGIATIGTWPEAARALSGRVDEAMTTAIDPDDFEASLERAFEKRAAVAIGPGLGTDERAKELCDCVVLGFEGPAVVDADAITCFAGRPEALREAKGPRVLTPHAGELGRLLGRSSSEIEGHRFAAARDAAKRTGCTVVLKGPHSVIATAGRLDVCGEGNAALGTAGSGDVLTGVTAAMLCQLPAHEAARAAVLLHARTADLWVAETGADRGMLASEIADGIPYALASLDEA